VFDPQTVADRATYEQPETLAAGMKYVIVNGKIALTKEIYRNIGGKPNR
jgi:N-acyl-D-amino-acid deacylase